MDEPTEGNCAEVRSKPSGAPVVAAGPSDLAVIPEELWVVARERFAALKPLLETGKFDSDAVAKRASECGLHRSTLYRWLRQYLKQHTLVCLLPQRPGPCAGGRRLTEDVEKIVEAALQNRFLTRQRLSPVHVARDVQLRCREEGLSVPSERTIRRRIAELPEELQLRRRFGYTAAQSLAPLRGRFPDVDEPLGAIQIDHTPLDLVLVDDTHRLPFGRPWLTLAIDIYTRMVVGFALAFEKPSTRSVGLCLVHAIHPKDDWLGKHGLATPWPIHGLMRQIHCDNAREFRGEMLKKACEQYGIELTFRRVKSPWYGGHIERLLGTFAKEIHALEGTTFSNPEERGSYPSEKKAALTLTEFETWFATLVVEVYHQRNHGALGMPPIRRFEQALRKAEPALPDLHRLRLDFLPYAARSVQRYGISLDGIHYYSDVLRRWIGSETGDKSIGKRRFVVRRDPRDISVVFFFDPELNCYFEIPYRDTSRPPLTLWDLREVRRRLVESGERQVNEDLIFQAYGRMQTSWHSRRTGAWSSCASPDGSATGEHGRFWTNSKARSGTRKFIECRTCCWSGRQITERRCWRAASSNGIRRRRMEAGNERF